MAMESKSVLVAKLNKIVGHSTEGELYFLLEDERLLIKKGDLDEQTQAVMTKEFINHTKQYLSQEEISIMGLSLADDRKDVLYHYDYEDRIPEVDYITSVQQNVLSDSYNFKHDDISKMKGYVFAFVDEDTRITLYKEHYPIMVMKKEAGETLKDKINIKLTNSNKITEVDDDIFKLNFDFDFMIVDGELYVKNLKKLESKFGFIKVLEKKANESVDTIDLLEIVEDISYLRNDITDASFARKIVKVASKSIVLQKCNKEDIIKFINESNDIIKNKFKFDESGNLLDLKTKKARKAFITLLDDSFLYSKLTDHDYLSGAKDDLSSHEI
ncbi:conserved protein of unknown function [Petrocella atlantisensis]|uniref:DUF4868 domain-containing protein n=1 Tax=Petrocella atlantisensis TaxID=2173034 RepID=A0A3P7PCW7_9FIRM|nr:anti-phage protein KwaB [Petrocella atlantisensis]VDN47903.1 conserved protein of unknown function [Petrocella atlantisensis]